jgi:hypothetical protein
MSQETINDYMRRFLWIMVGDTGNWCKTSEHALVNITTWRSFNGNHQNIETFQLKSQVCKKQIAIVL